LATTWVGYGRCRAAAGGCRKSRGLASGKIRPGLVRTLAKLQLLESLGLGLPRAGLGLRQAIEEVIVIVGVVVGEGNNSC
jgi:hypothetical protein